MASTSPEGEAAATPLAGTVQVAAGLHARRTPLVAIPGARVLSGIGDVGRAAGRFSALTGLSLSARRAVQAQRSDVRRQLVRPPDFWSGYQEEEERITGRPSTGDAALDKLIARRATQKREATARSRPQRGLPSTIHRRSHSVAGPMTAPGGMARRLLPATIVPAANPANSPQTAASREARPARPTRPARPGQGDRPRPAAPPSPTSSTARRAAEQAARAEADQGTRAATPSASVSTGAVASSPSTGAGGATPTTAAAVIGPAPRAATDAPIRRSAAPSELDPRTAADPDWVGTAASGTNPTTTVSTVAAGAGTDPTATVAAAAGATSGAGLARSRDAGVHAGPRAEAAPPWPGDLPDVDVATSSPFAATTVGRRVAVRPLLAGWRAPTAWRSIPAAPGLRLLPIGPGGLQSSSSAGAGVTAGAGSWADTVRRAVRAATDAPGSVRDLPVGGPAVVVRQAGGSTEDAIGRRAAGVGRESVTRSGNAPARPSSAPPAAADRAVVGTGRDAAAGGRAAGAGRESVTRSGNAPARPSSAPPAAADRAVVGTGRDAAGGRTAASAAAGVGPAPASAPARVGTTGAARVARRLVRPDAAVAGDRSTSPADTWSSIGGRRAAGPAASTGSPIFLRRHVAASPSGSAVELTAWALPPGRTATATSAGPLGALVGVGATAPSSSVAAERDAIRRTPGFRPADARRPGGWLGRAAATGSAGALAGGVHRVPMGPLGPVRWSARADEPVVARSTSPASSWAASVAAAAAVMGGTASLTGGAIRPPVTNGLTLVRGGRADGSDLPVASVQRASTHPAATRLRLVPSSGDGADGTAIRRSPAEVAHASTSVSGSASPSAYVGRASAGSVPFLSIPGAVAAHGLPAARASLVGVTASGLGAGSAATPGALGRLVHGEPIRRRVAYDLAPPALVGGGASSTASASTGPRSERPGLPVTPAALVRRRLAEQLPVGGAAAERSGGFGATWAQRVAIAAGTGGPAAVARLMAANPVGPSWIPQSSTTSLGASASSPIRRSSRDDARSTTADGRPAADRPAAPAARHPSSDVSPTTRSSRDASPTTTSAAPPVTASAWAQRLPATGPGRSVPATPATADLAGPTWAQRVAAAGQGRSLPATPAVSSAATAPGSLLAPPVYATGGASVASLRGLPVAPAAFGVVRGSGPSAAVGGRTTSSSSANASSAGRATTADGTSTSVHRSRTPHGVSATVARRLRDRPPRLVADRWRGADVPARALPGRAPSALRPIAAPEVVRRTPIRASAPGAATRFDEVLRSTGAPVRPVALPVRFRPLAERIIGRMPVQIATGAASRQALAAVGTTAATTGSVIHLPSAPDGSARMAGILAHELTHVAAASPVARFHGGRPSIEETAATQVERIVARAARTSGQGRGPSSPGTKGLPVAGFLGVRGTSSGPPAAAPATTISRSAGTTSAADLARRIESGSTGGSSGSGSGTVQRVVAQSEAPPPTRPSKAADRRIRRKRAPEVASGLESDQEAADETNVLSDDALDAIVRALEVRLLESIERRGGLWRGGF